MAKAFFFSDEVAKRRFRKPFLGFTGKAVFLCLALLSASSLTRGQGTSYQEKFHQATEAMRSGHLDEAGNEFASITKEFPGFAEAHLNLGLVREEQGRNEEAIASLQKALSLKPRLRGANLFLAIAQYRLNHFDKAIAAVQKETAYYRSDANAWMWLGVIQLAAENPEQAAAALDKAAKLAPDNVDILYHRGRAHLLVSKNSYEKMFQIDPQSWQVHQVLAQADAEADRHDDAIAEYKAAIQLAPTQPGLHEQLGTEYLKANNLDSAVEALQRELEIDPNNVLARYKLGLIEVERGEGAKSKELIEGAVRQNPGLKDSAYYLGRAEMELGNNAEAAEALGRAIASPDTDPEIVQQAWYQLGVVYRRLHRIDDAQKAFATFQKLKDDAAKRIQERLQRRGEAGSGQNPPRAPQSPQKPQNPG
jgi:tetratricopeptide (TPR) repeat protein